ncbi:HNH endonuclease [Citrobacter portucalensis]|uniref:HNH endonuclease signature motif containing protein n=1 Tax=Citrobacter portucalensis TaxID=1639133 RepID=UPI001EF8FA7A|nr:HNH endonuclease signature motif containing protein [Citrobacter portucalensis]ULK55016.1 HNH endonuclease [Citrobacter portucalensis]
MNTDAYAPELLRSLFRYDEETGRLFHAVDRMGTNKRIYAKAGNLADTATDSAGYRRVSVRVDGKCHMLYAHRVVWILSHGIIPDGLCIDHINAVRDDNRRINLRIVTPQENQHNYRKAKGYSRHARSGKWEAYIRVDGVRHHLGLFTTEAAARAAYLKAKARYHPSTPADLLQAA